MIRVFLLAFPLTFPEVRELARGCVLALKTSGVYRNLRVIARFCDNCREACGSCQAGLPSSIILSSFRLLQRNAKWLNSRATVDEREF